MGWMIGLVLTNPRSALYSHVYTARYFDYSQSVSIDISRRVHHVNKKSRYDFFLFTMKLNLTVQWNYFVMIFSIAKNIFASAKVMVQFYICNIITALAISTTVQAQMLWHVCNYKYERKRIISLLNVSNIIVSATNNIIKVIKIKNT